MLALLQLLLPERATEQRVALLIHPETEPLVSNAHLGGVATWHYAIVRVMPLLHCFHESMASADVLGAVRRGTQCSVPVPW